MCGAIKGTTSTRANSFASDARKLEKAGLAKPFSWKAVWEEECLTGSLNINSVATGTSGPVLQCSTVNFDVTPKQYLLSIG